MNASVWRGRAVFVTGHTGFKGAWLCLWLARLGARITGFALPPERAPNLFDLARVSGRMHSVLGDVRSADALAATLQSARPEIVFHLAAQSLVRRSYAKPLETFATNVAGTVHLLEAVRQVSTVRAVVVVTSDKCYENRGLDRGYTEDDALGGFDPYSASKACTELVTASYRQSFLNGEPPSPAVASARAGNVIGGGDWADDRLLPDLIHAFDTGEVARIRNPHAVRPWQHVLDPLAGYLRLAEALLADGRSHARSWNFGPDTRANASVGEVADLAARAWGGEARWQADVGTHPHEAAVLMLDASRARRELDWAPRLDLARAVAETIDWHRALAAGGDAADLCLRQIGRYSAIVPPRIEAGAA